MDKLEIKQGSFIQQTQYFIPVEIDWSVVPARLGIWLFQLSRRTTVIQDLLVRRQFSLVPDNRTNVNVKACIYAFCGDVPCTSHIQISKFNEKQWTNFNLPLFFFWITCSEPLSSVSFSRSVLMSSGCISLGTINFLFLPFLAKLTLNLSWLTLWSR